MKKIIKILIISTYFFCYSFSIADEKKVDIQIVYKLLQEKKFEEGIENLKILSNQNEIDAQLLYSKILFSGDIIPQNFEEAYFWGLSALLGGLKKSSKIIEKLDDYLVDKQIETITIKLSDFLEKRAFEKDKRAIIQIAKLHEAYKEPPDMINAYTWYNIAVAQGIKTAKSKRDEVLEYLSEKDLLDAQALSIKLFKKIND
mgnify:CR=1 FL=1